MTDAVADLIRRVYAAAPGFNAWTFARFDIWARWRRADEELAGDTRWRESLRLWGDDAAAFVGEAPDDGVLVLAPGALPLVPELLEWIESRCARPLLVEVNESNRALSEAVARRGYELVDGHYVPRRKRLVRNPPPALALTPITDDIPAYLDASAAVFGRRFTSEAYRYLHGARSYDRSLGLMVVEDGQVVAFANAWLDRTLGVAELEPVGTRPGHQGRGLASAVVREVENRLLDLGIATGTVHSWSESEGANRLYDRLGYVPVDRQRNWRN